MPIADDYVSVAERVQEFYKKYPEGSVQCEILTHTDSLVVIRATVFRSADDRVPAIAHSQLGIPGKTNFTRGAELENAETSAVGRAIAFMGFAAKGIASRDEVNKNNHDFEPSAYRWNQFDLAKSMEAHGKLVSADFEVLQPGRPVTKENLILVVQEWLSTHVGATVDTVCAEVQKRKTGEIPEGDHA